MYLFTPKMPSWKWYWNTQRDATVGFEDGNFKQECNLICKNGIAIGCAIFPPFLFCI